MDFMILLPSIVLVSLMYFFVEKKASSKPSNFDKVSYVTVKSFHFSNCIIYMIALTGSYFMAPQSFLMIFSLVVVHFSIQCSLISPIYSAKTDQEVCNLIKKNNLLLLAVSHCCTLCFLTYIKIFTPSFHIYFSYLSFGLLGSTLFTIINIFISRWKRRKITQ